MANPVRSHVKFANGFLFVPQEANRRKPEYAGKIILRCGFQIDIAKGNTAGDETIVFDADGIKGLQLIAEIPTLILNQDILIGIDPVYAILYQRRIILDMNPVIDGPTCIIRYAPTKWRKLGLNCSFSTYLSSMILRTPPPQGESGIFTYSANARSTLVENFLSERLTLWSALVTILNRKLTWSVMAG